MKHDQHEDLLGTEVLDLVTQLEGIVTAVSYYLNGCVRVCVQPRSEENKPATEVEWCDVQQVRVRGAGVRRSMGIDAQTSTPAGGPQKRDAPRS